MRTDIHSPKAIIPADYAFVGYSYLGPNWGDFQYSTHLRKVINDHMVKTGGRYSGHEHGGSCHICGANALYMAVFHHVPSNVYIKTGLDCADKMAMDSGDGETFRKTIRAGLEAIAGKKKAMAYLETNGLLAAWELYNSDHADRWEENTLADMVAKLVQYGGWSDKQVSFARSLLAKIADRPRFNAAVAAAAANIVENGRIATLQANPASPAPVVANVPKTPDRLRIVGVVVSTKWQESPYGTVQKMLVVSQDGYKLWGTIPRGLTAKRGDKVAFVAKVEPSRNDPAFGFFSRPTNPELIEAMA